VTVTRGKRRDKTTKTKLANGNHSKENQKKGKRTNASMQTYKLGEDIAVTEGEEEDVGERKNRLRKSRMRVSAGEVTG